MKLFFYEKFCLIRICPIQQSTLKMAFRVILSQKMLVKEVSVIVYFSNTGDKPNKSSFHMFNINAIAIGMTS